MEEENKPVEENKPLEENKPVETTVPVEETATVEEAKPVETTMPVEEAKPVEEIKPVEEVKEEPVKKDNILTKKTQVSGKPLKIWIIIMIIVFMLFTFGLGMALGKELARKEVDNSSKPTEEPKKEEKKEEEKKEENKNNLDFDFNAMENTLNSQLQSGQYQAVKISCTSTPGPEGELPTVIDTGTRISNESFNTIVGKLKTAQSVDKNVTAGWIGECMPKSVAYIISVNDNPASNEFQNNKIFTLYYLDAAPTLLISYEGVGYAFNFNSFADIDNFIETLN